jgi:hypothetical protein
VASVEPRFVVRILSSGGSKHRELERLLQSLRDADYSLPADSTLAAFRNDADGAQPHLQQQHTMRVDVEIVVDVPPAMRLPPVPGPDSGATAAEIAWAGERLRAVITSERFQEAKFEHDLTLALAQQFEAQSRGGDDDPDSSGGGQAWPPSARGGGRVSVRAIEQTRAREHGGVFNMFFAYDAPTAFGLGLSVQAQNTFVVTLRDSHVLSTQWAQALRSMIVSHWNSGAGSGGNSATLDAQSLLGVLLEPAELVLGVSKRGQPFRADVSPESLVFPVLSEEINPAIAPALFYAQSVVGHSGSVGGFVLRASDYAELKNWVVAQGLLQPDSQNARSSDEPGAPLLQVYSRASLATLSDPCVPLLASNRWLRPNMSALAHLHQLDQDEALHRYRAGNDWFVLGLVQRFMYEKNVYMLNWLPPSNSGMALVSSSLYELPHAHAHDHHAGHSDADEEQHAVEELAATAEERAAVPLPPLKRELLPTSSTLWRGARVTAVPALFDFAYNHKPLPARGGVAKPLENVMSAAEVCEAANAVKGVPVRPPRERPSAAESARLQKQLQSIREKNRAAAQEAGLAPLIKHEHHEEEEDEDALGDEAASSAQQVQLDGAGGENSAAGLNLTHLSSEALVRAALRTAASHRTNIALCTYVSSSPGFLDSAGFPLLDWSRGPWITDPELLYSNTSEQVQACFDEYEADLQLALHRVPEADPSAEKARSRHRLARRQLAAIVKSITAELQKKELMEQLKRQLIAIEDEAQERRDRALVQKYLARQKAERAARKAAGKLTDADGEADPAKESAEKLKQEARKKAQAEREAKAKKLQDEEEARAKAEAAGKLAPGVNPNAPTKPLTAAEKKAAAVAAKAAALAEQLRQDELDEAREAAELASKRAEEEAEQARLGREQLLADKRRTGEGEIESEEEYQRLLEAIKQRKMGKREPLNLGQQLRLRRRRRT